MRIRKPVGPSERCGVSATEKIGGFAMRCRCRGHGAQYREGWPESRPRGKRLKRRLRKARGKGKAATAQERRRAGRGRHEGRRRRVAAMDTGRNRGGVPPLPGRRSRRRKTELEHVDPTRCWSRWCCRRRRPTPASTRRRRLCSRAADTPAKMVELGEAQRARLHQDHRPVPHQGEERHRAVAAAGRRAWRQGAALREALEALPGVGRKTANVVLNVAFGEPTIAVDTHIFRVGNRTGLATGKTPLEVEQKLERWCPTNTSCTPITG